MGGSPEAHADGVPASPRGPILVPTFNELPRASKRRRTAVESVGDGATAAVDFRHSDFITCDVRLEGVEYDLDADDERFLLDTVNPRLAGARTASDAATRLSLDAFEVLVEELEREAFAAAQLRSLVHENHLMQHQLTLQDEVVSLLAAAAQLEGELAMPPHRCRRRCLRRCHGRLSRARVHHHQLIKVSHPSGQAGTRAMTAPTTHPKRSSARRSACACRALARAFDRAPRGGRAAPGRRQSCKA